MKALAILQLIPVIIAAVKSVEDLVPLPGKGKEKLDAVLELVTKVAGVSAEMMPAITSMIEVIVRLANATGAFKKGGK